MKTLPEILDNYKRSLHEAYITDTPKMSFAADDRAQAAIAKELMGCLPESLNIEKLYSESESYRSSRQPDIDNGHNQALDEVRARLTAFIGKGEK